MYIFTVLLMLSFLHSLESVNLNCDSIPKPASPTAGEPAAGGGAGKGGAAAPPPPPNIIGGARSSRPPVPPAPAASEGVDPNSRVCGTNRGAGFFKYKRQSRGSSYKREVFPDVDSGNSPWLVFIQPIYKEKKKSKVIREHACTGILITSKYALLAASCIPEYLDYSPGFRLKRVQIILGFGTKGKTRKGSNRKRVTRHPEYDPANAVTSVDAALVKIKNLQLSFSVAPCCMGTCNAFYGAANILPVNVAYFSDEIDPDRGELVAQEVSAKASTADTGDCLAKRPGLDPEKHFCVDPVTTCYGEQGASVTRPLGDSNLQLVGMAISTDCDASKPLVALYLRYISQWIVDVTGEEFQ